MLYPKFKLDVNKEFDLDVQVAASGFTKKQQCELEKVNNQQSDYVFIIKKQANDYYY
jgi:RIO kinase 2